MPACGPSGLRGHLGSSGDKEGVGSCAVTIHRCRGWGHHAWDVGGWGRGATGVECVSGADAVLQLSWTRCTDSSVSVRRVVGVVSGWLWCV